VGQIGLELPYGLPGHWEIGEKYPQGSARRDRELLSPVLPSQLLAFALEFDGESHTPLILCANTLRVLSEKPIPVAEIPCLTGGSPEICGNRMAAQAVHRSGTRSKCEPRKTGPPVPASD
jgi:hypothetical protein